MTYVRGDFDGDGEVCGVFELGWEGDLGSTVWGAGDSTGAGFAVHLPTRIPIAKKTAPITMVPSSISAERRSSRFNSSKAEWRRSSNALACCLSVSDDIAIDLSDSLKSIFLFDGQRRNHQQMPLCSDNADRRTGYEVRFSRICNRTPEFSSHDYRPHRIQLLFDRGPAAYQDQVASLKLASTRQHDGIEN